MGQKLAWDLALLAQPNGRGWPGRPKPPDAAECADAYHGHHTQCTRGVTVASGGSGNEEGNGGWNKHEEGRWSASGKVYAMGAHLMIGATMRQWEELR
jgi:hypothetical protein